MELAYIFEKCLKLLPWLQDYIPFFGRVGEPGSGKGEGLKIYPGLHSLSVYHSVT